MLAILSPQEPSQCRPGGVRAPSRRHLGARSRPGSVWTPSQPRFGTIFLWFLNDLYRFLVDLLGRFCNDFGSNPSMLLEKRQQGKSFPLRFRDHLVNSMPMLFENRLSTLTLLSDTSLVGTITVQRRCDIHDPPLGSEVSATPLAETIKIPNPLRT